MPIAIIDDHDGLLCPVAICDMCQEVITDTAGAHVAYWPTGGSLAFIHRGDCHRRLDDITPHSYWQPMNEFMAQLVHNTTHPWPRPVHRDDVLASLALTVPRSTQ